MANAVFQAKEPIQSIFGQNGRFADFSRILFWSVSEHCSFSWRGFYRIVSTSQQWPGYHLRFLRESIFAYFRRYRDILGCRLHRFIAFSGRGDWLVNAKPIISFWPRNSRRRPSLDVFRWGSRAIVTKRSSSNRIFFPYESGIAFVFHPHNQI
jgi:hypothetical protein